MKRFQQPIQMCLTTVKTSVAAASLLLVTLLPASAQTFDELRKQVQVSPATQSEQTINKLLGAGLAEGKPSQAIAETRKWLRQNLPQDPVLLCYAGRAAELSGDWKGAVALYQQYLKRADLKSATADEAVYAVYTLLIHRLKDTSAAYTFGRTEGNRMMVCPRARQFDAWFLSQAESRKDIGAVADRLNACFKAGFSNDLLEAHYTQHFVWLFNNLDGYIDRRGVAQLTKPYYEATKQLVGNMKFNDELKQLIDVAASIRHYNTQKNAGADVEPPVAEAKALLSKYPNHALWVQTAWAGGGNGQHYRGKVANYWPHKVDEKMAPIMAAVSKMSPAEADRLLSSWTGYYASGPVITSVKSVRDFLLANPQFMNRRNGPIAIENHWSNLSFEEVSVLAKHLDQNAREEAAMIRVIAAAGKEGDVDKMVKAYTMTETWRLPLHNDKRNALITNLVRYRPFSKSLQKVGNEVSKKMQVIQPKQKAISAKLPANEKLNEFKKLWADYKSSIPRIVGVKELISSLVSHTPEAIPLLLADGSPEAHSFARSAISTGIKSEEPLWKIYANFGAVSTSRYAPSFMKMASHHRGIQEVKSRYPEKAKPHPLEAEFRKLVEQGVKKKQLEPWVFLAWLNMQYPEDNAAQVELAKQVKASPVWSKLSKFTSYGAERAFGQNVMPDNQIKWLTAVNADIICKDLMALTEDADASKAASALRSAISGMRQSPRQVSPKGLDLLAKVKNEVLYDPKVFNLIVELADSLRIECNSDEFGKKVMAHILEDSDPVVMHQTAAFLCSYALNDAYKEDFRQVYKAANDLISSQPSVSLALSRIAYQTFDGQRNDRHFNAEKDLPRLKIISGKATMAMGLVVIPVAKNHPAYPVYQSQADWLTGNEDSAWTLVGGNWEAFLSEHRQLTVPYLMWVLQRTIYARDETRQEILIKSLLAWSNEASSPLTLEEKINVDILYGDIAMQRGQLRQAHEIYSRTEKKEAYKDSTLRFEATLRKANAERIAKDFDGALETLNTLALEKIPEIWTKIRYTRAEVSFDMEEFDDSKDDIDSILTREPNHADAKILLGKVQLKRQKLMEATEVELGSATDQKSLFPGEKLKVTLSDPTLAVSGAGTSIEVIVWATSGDKETFFLRQFGDQKTKFRGEVATALGAPKLDDDVLQVIGNDKVYYAYSDAFRKKMNNIDAKEGGPIIISSDAVLMASARKLLTEEEQRAADMQALMDKIKIDWRGGSAETAAKAKLAAQSLSADARAKVESEEDDYSKFNRYITNVAKPGNPIHVRVIDPDKSRTADVDELNVSVTSSSGDSVGRVTLKETGTHTGWFEGSVPTAGAQALAFARNTEPGRNPNMVISPKADSYPAWRPTPLKNGKHEFKVDLNDNVEIDKLIITAKEEGAKLKSFALQVGMNPTSFRTIATYPESATKIRKPWHPSVLVMNDTDQFHMNTERSVYDVRGMSQHINQGWLGQKYAQGIARNVPGVSGAFPSVVLEEVKWKRQNHHDSSSGIFRFRGYFHEKDAVTRRFKLSLGRYNIPKNTHPSVNAKPNFMIAVDGKPISKEGGPLQGAVDLKPGVHSFEIWGAGWIKNMGFGKRDVRLETGLDVEGPLELVSDDFFNPDNFPKGVLDHRNRPATVEAGADGSEFTVNFVRGSRARVLRLVFIDHEGAVPALNKLQLTRPGGKVVLPVPEDFASLNKNDTLEILTGDTVAVRYTDDRFVTKSKQRLERSLNVEFTDASVQFADMKPRWSGKHQKDMPYYEELLRFQYGKPISLAVRDADMDVSVKPDVVKVKVKSASGTFQEFDAKETGDSTGLFELIVTPVRNAAKGKGEIQVALGDRLIANYWDAENNRPGVPVEREAIIDFADFVPPQFVLSHTTATPTKGESMRTLLHGFERRDYVSEDDAKRISESVQPRWQLNYEMVAKPKAPDDAITGILGRRIYVELLAPHTIMGVGAKAVVYAQTDAGRKRAGIPDDGAFDIDVPGTIRVSAGITKHQIHADPWGMVPKLETYMGDYIPFRDNSGYDRYYIQIPLISDVLPNFGALSPEEHYNLVKQADKSRRAADYLDMTQRISGLVVKPGERLHIGFKYTDGAGNDQWLQTSAKVTTHPVFDIMAEDYRKPMTSAYVGENLNLRVVDLGADISDTTDSVFVLLQAQSGAKQRVELRESGPHTGIFKSEYALTYVKDENARKEADGLTSEAIRLKGFPVVYGDKVAARYTDADGIKTDTLMVSVSKGADGSISPFSKTYEDEEIAMRTQFSLAEAYLEMAKRHRKLGQPEKAAIEYASAKQLLSKAMDQFSDPDTRANAEYLLGNLTLEEADVTEDTDLKETRYRAALTRFMTVTSSYPQTIHASKAQYKIATIYERLKEPEIAAQEYVKLAYKYPDSEFLAMSMLRLGTHFLRKASAYEKKSLPLLAKEDDKDAQFEGMALNKLAVREYIKTAQIFGRMQERFPSHEFAGDAGLRSGQAYMRAKNYKGSLAAFKRVVNEQSYDGPKIRAQAMYWMGMCYLETREQMSAYSTFKRLTYDFPESQSAAFARGQLSQERLLKLETDLEIERLEAGR